ncbi:MAG: HAMP domain-containing histidine kinase [Saccharofermentans sp.]|nr:HAMP domain-containing histidine kinase [Saccharofermentans sp.]
MSSSKSSKNVSASFAVFLNTFLIISTVIVFAVLLFLSYESMMDTSIIGLRDTNERTCNDVCADINKTIENSDLPWDDDFNLTLIETYVRSEVFSDNGAIYIVDEYGNVYYRSKEALDVKNVDAREIIAKSYEQVPITTEDQTFNSYSVVTCQRIKGSSIYCVVMNTLQFSEVRSEYISVIFLPAMVAMLIAVALFIGFIGMTIRPFKEISRSVSKVAEGDFSTRIDKKYTNASDISSLTLSSDLAEMARTINYMIEALENQENDRNIFISSVAHDIRTPLTSINGFITAMLDGTIPHDKQDKYLQLIKQEVDRIRKLIVSMTEASSLSHIDPELMEEFDIKDVVTDIKDNLEPQLMEKNIELITDVDTSEGTMVYGEAQQLCRVLVNIISNAIKFTPEEGKIRVTTRPDSKERIMRISVEDSGPGVEKEKRARVFESFYKADPSRKQEGFGLGLYICKQILHGHGQTITLDESQEFGGAKFDFAFPYPPEDKK